MINIGWLPIDDETALVLNSGAGGLMFYLRGILPSMDNPNSAMGKDARQINNLTVCQQESRTRMGIQQIYIYIYVHT